MPPPSRPDLFEFLDYQEFLREFFAGSKVQDPLFSYRVFAVAVDIDPSLLVKIIQGKRHLARDGIESMVQFLRLNPGEANYFRTLVAYNKADSDADIRIHFEKLLSLRPANAKQIHRDLYRYFQHWYYPAVRAALDFEKIQGPEDYTHFANIFHPKLSVSQVGEAIEVLQRLGLISQNASGDFSPTSAHLSTGDRWQSAAVGEYQRQVIELGASCIGTIPKMERDISSLTLSLDRKSLERIRSILAEARRTIVQIVDTMPPADCDAVYQLNIQMFPVARKETAP